MKLELMTFNDLLALYNSMSEKKAGPKTFASRKKMIERIEKLAADKNVDLSALRQATSAEVTEQCAQPQADTTETTDTTEKKSSGKGIGRLAREILMDPTGYPHALIAKMVNAQVDGAQATAKSVRWYAHDMRKKGIEVPERRKVFATQMNEEESAEWLAGVTVVEPAQSEDE
ncbi:MAG: hypothetical protein R3260_03055 [Pseudomonas sp.]|nr:hypothetical protein [Pseudomonas sp.]